MKTLGGISTCRLGCCWIKGLAVPNALNGSPDQPHVPLELSEPLGRATGMGWRMKQLGRGG